MILLLYNFVVHLIQILLIPISWFNKKIKLFLNGRKKTFTQIASIKKQDKVIWFHCASLGEFEQGRPIIESIRENPKFKNHKIVLTFFSPSGYEVRKNYAFADVVCYLPMDTKSNMKKFIRQIHPEIVIIVKYEFWPNLLTQLKKQNIKTVLISAIFRKNQALFKPFGKFIRKTLSAFDHIFVQNEISKKLLKNINFKDVIVVGDTRFDRVIEIAKENSSIPIIKNFIQPNTNFTLVAGSTWKKDEDLLVNYINNHAKDDQQFIIAPHNIDKSAILKLKESIQKKVVLYTEIKSDKEKIEAKILILDTIGMLSKVYKYGDLAYIGGGFGAGIHNTLEPAAFGLPILIGPNYQKFNEAVELIKAEACFIINNKTDLKNSIQLFYTNKKHLETTIKHIKNYVSNNIGAKNSILAYLNK